MFYDIRKPANIFSAFYQTLHSDVSCVRFNNSADSILTANLQTNCRLACSTDEGTLAVYDLTQQDEEEALECFFNLDQTINRVR